MIEPERRHPLILKGFYRLKVVPDNDRNANGRWVEIPERVDALCYLWNDLAVTFAKWIPEGHHVVAYTCKDRGGL